MLKTAVIKINEQPVKQISYQSDKQNKTEQMNQSNKSM